MLHACCLFAKPMFSLFRQRTCSLHMFNVASLVYTIAYRQLLPFVAVAVAAHDCLCASEDSRHVLAAATEVLLKEPRLKLRMYTYKNTYKNI